MNATADPGRATGPYGIGWWAHPWWPTKKLLIGLATGNQWAPRADTGGYFVGRRRFVSDILRRLRLIRRPHRPWQAESGQGCWFARRAFTPDAAERKIVADMEHYLRHGLPSPYQYWRLRRKARHGEARR